MTLKTTIKKHLNLRILLYVLSSCFTIITMFYPISCKKPKESASQESVEMLRNEQDRLKQSVQLKLNGLAKRNDSLQFQLRQINAKLSSQKAQLKIKRSRIKIYMQGGDSSAISCDSLKQVVTEYVSADEHQDSLYEEAITELEQIVEVKDSTIDVFSQSLDHSQQMLERSLNAQEVLGKNMTGLEKKLRRKQFFNRALTAGILVLAGTTAILVVR